MKKKLALGLGCGFVLCSVLVADGQSEDEKGIRRALDNYLHGACTQGVEKLNDAWDVPHAHMKFVVKDRDGKERTSVRFIEDMIQNWTSKEAKSYSGEVMDMDIVEGQIASVKYKFVWEETTFIDYLTLFKLNGEWKIVNKVFVKL